MKYKFFYLIKLYLKLVETNPKGQLQGHLQRSIWSIRSKKAKIFKIQFNSLSYVKLRDKSPCVKNFSLRRRVPELRPAKVEPHPLLPFFIHFRDFAMKYKVTLLV